MQFGTGGWGSTSASQPYDVDSFLGYVSTGADIRVSKRLSVGAMFKYYAVLSAREGQNYNNNSATLYGGPTAAMVGYDTFKQQVGSTVARSAMYSVTGGVSFTF
jgi:hypothetical protein